MRQYTVLFLEQRIGVARLTQIPGEAGEAQFIAPDDDAALMHITAHLIDRIKECARAEVSSLALVADGGGGRIIDDSLSNPYFQEMYLTYDPRVGELRVDFESTRTTLLTSVM